MSDPCVDIENNASVASGVGPGQVLRVNTAKDEETEFLNRSSTPLEKLMSTVSDLDRRHASTCRVRKIITEIEPLVGFIEHDSKAVDFFVQGVDRSLLSPAAVVWRLRCVVLLVRMITCPAIETSLTL